ncbi:MAG: cupin domain-containing protein [Acidimicrobiia bacterium]
MPHFTDWNAQAGAEVFPGDIVWSVTGDDLQVIRAEIAPGTNFGLHRHPQEQIICIVQGLLEFTVEGETRVLGPGQVIHAPANSEHGGRVVSDQPVVTIESFSPPRINFRDGDHMDFGKPE